MTTFAPWKGQATCPQALACPESLIQFFWLAREQHEQNIEVTKIGLLSKDHHIRPARAATNEYGICWTGHLNLNDILQLLPFFHIQNRRATWSQDFSTAVDKHFIPWLYLACFNHSPRAGHVFPNQQGMVSRDTQLPTIQKNAMSLCRTPLIRRAYFTVAPPLKRGTSRFLALGILQWPLAPRQQR